MVVSRADRAAACRRARPCLGVAGRRGALARRVLQTGRQLLDRVRLAGHKRLGDINPALVWRRDGSGDWTVRAWIREGDVDGVRPDRGLDVQVRRQQRRIPDGDPDPLVDGLVEGDVGVDHAPEVDYREEEQEQEWGDDGELYHRLGTLATTPSIAHRFCHVRSPRRPYARWRPA